MKTLMRLTAAAAIFLAALAAEAGAQGRVVGRVTDSAGNGVEGVVVTLTTPAIKNFKLGTKTGADGKYGSIVNDATFPYHFRYEKPGYAVLEIDKKLSIGDATTLDVKLMKDSEVAAKPGAPGAQPAAPSASEQATLAFNAGVDLMNGGDKAGAIAKFQEATVKNPDLPQAWQALTALSYQNKDWAHVIEYGQKATDLDPTMTSIYGMMAEAASKTGDKKASGEYRQKYEVANPDTPEMLYNKGIDAYNKKNSKDAEDLLGKAVAAKPDFALAHYYMALAAMNNKHNAVAREHLQKYLELDPSGSEAATAKELLPLVK
ncbi:MAG: carboxypeptidase regulatory-like domain-containing protein [Acidobacteriota bacterium]